MHELKKEQAKKAIEATRIQFHELLVNVQDVELSTPSIVTKRTLLGVLAHLVIATEKAYPMLVKKAQQGKAMPVFFGTTLGHYFSYRYSEFRGKQLKDIEAIRKAYDLAHEELIKLVDTITEKEWEDKTALPKPSSKSLTVYEVFTDQVPNHFAVHREEILKSIRK